ncbi:Lrp/AsnC family transcriptional regulator, partial [Rhizobium tibeticum]
MYEIDAIDRKIIRQLRLNSRISNVDLGKEVGLSASACLRRIALMERAGIIKGYTALVDMLGEDAIAVIIQITLERQTEEYLNRFETAVRKYP